jgi:hypothetical protein
MHTKQQAASSKQQAASSTLAPAYTMHEDLLQTGVWNSKFLVAGLGWKI